MVPIPPELASLPGSKLPLERLLAALIEQSGIALECDRTLLFLRDPESTLSKMTHEWCRKPEYALERPRSEWTPQPPSLPKDDPMYGEALHNPVALYIEDVRTSGPEVLNREYEERIFKHRALVHAPIYADGKMYGIYEPCVFEEPRTWSADDKALTEWLQKTLSPLAVRYVAENCPSP